MAKSESQTPTIVWFRQDLRVTDNVALCWAAARGPIIPLYMHPDKGDPWQPGGAGRWWLHHALADLQKSLQSLGVALVLRQGDPLSVLHGLAAATGAKAVTWGRCYEPHAIKRDSAIKAALQAEGLEVVSHNNALLFEPWTIKSGSGTPYKVYTPFSKTCLAAEAPATPLEAPKKLTGIDGIPTEKLEDWELLPQKPDWSGGMKAFWRVSEKDAQTQMAQFVRSHIDGYKTARDRPDQDATSRLSPYLHWGQISPRQIWAAVKASGKTGAGSETYVKELLWREFSYHLLYHFPDFPEKPLNPAFAQFPWRNDDKDLRAWQCGLTGYPIVDAGMRQLWQTGWMHNRVRMIVASFLIKDLLLPWQAGEAWFWDTLVDADLASNAASWQWVAGCGADAAPYYRIFNPVLQGLKFDPEGDYVRRYVPELAKLPASVIHVPWKATAAELRGWGVVLGQNYPKPMVDHAEARVKALEALAETKKT